MKMLSPTVPIKASDQAEMDAKEAARKERHAAQIVAAKNVHKYEIERPGVDLDIVRRVLPDITTITSEFCDAHGIGFERVFPELSLDVIAHVQAYGMSGRDELLGVTARLIRAYLPRVVEK